MIGFGEAVRRFYKNYANFYGRASRAEYWWVFLMQLLVVIAFIMIFVFAAAASPTGATDDIPAFPMTILILGTLFVLINLIPNYALAARRFHDLNQTGWLVLVFVLANAFIGVTWIAQMIWFAMQGTQGRNQYGPDPYGADADVFG